MSVGVEQLVSALGSRALYAAVDGEVVVDFGATTEPTRVASVRKSLMSGLIGIAVDRGLLDLDATLDNLGIDDHSALSPTERGATVRDLIRARSGVVHPAASQAPLGIPRGTYAPGEKWLYNNWDFNVLGTIFAEAAGLGVFEAFDAWIARPVGMEDFDISLCEYQTVPESRHAAYKFMLSPRDLARVGLLYLRRGDWGGRQILSPDWIETSTETHSRAEPPHHFFDGYGYLWWTATLVGQPVFAATGALAEGLVIAPDAGLVIVHANQPIRIGGKTVGWHPPTWTDLQPTIEALIAAAG